MQKTHVTHEFAPLYDPECKILILGSIPSPKSREQAFYYGHPQNRFWKVMSAVLGEKLPLTVEEKKEMLLRHHIALWDVLEECDICGAGDSSIENPVPTNVAELLKKTHICRICTTGAAADRFYRRFHLPLTGIPAVRLPSTSPANAAWSLEKLTEAYRALLCPLP